MSALHPTGPSSIGRVARSPLSRRAFFAATGLAALGAGLAACGGGGGAGSTSPSSASGDASSVAAGAYGDITGRDQPQSIFDGFLKDNKTGR